MREGRAIHMKILIGQPKMEQHLEQFIQDIEANPEVDLILYPEGYCQTPICFIGLSQD